ncbi:MAG: efflux RND transporter permease subunit, partial [Candidatus Brocadiaceae bacterium]|nr:efflux RND transporter permease subunit [Candidatus Brocadiaceae bacterium]
GIGTITLKFKIGISLDDALLRVSNKLNEVPSYPENVDKPIISATGAASPPVIWMVLKTTDNNPASAFTYKTYFENEVRQYIDRVEGVADLLIRGGREREMHIVIKPEKLAAYGLTIRELIHILQSENINISAGNMGVGRRDYRIRTVGEFNSEKEIENIVIRSTGQERILLSDLATVNFGYEKLTEAMLHNGAEGIAIGIKPEPGSNILNLTNRINAVVTWLNNEKLKEEKICLEWVYDQRPYINGAIQLVKKNIFYGGLLAIIVLFIFLGSIAPTLIIAISIPISIIGTFIFMSAFGRNLNVVSLAGISFSVGMLVDNAIVVLENIDRHRKTGKSAVEAAYQGTKEVWGAILASTLTTIAIFLPIVLVQEEAGQLFRDIAIAITFAITLSLFVSVSVIPVLSHQLFRLQEKNQSSKMNAGIRAFQGAKAWGKSRMGAFNNILLNAGKGFSNIIMNTVQLAIKNWKTRIITIALLTLMSVAAIFLLFPKMEYLPHGNRNLIMSILVPPPGLSYKERRDMGEHIHSYVVPYMKKDHNGYPGIRNIFYIGAETMMAFGAMSMHEERARELVPLFMQIINTIPGMYGISLQAGIFEKELGAGRTIDINVIGDDINRIVQAASALFGMIGKEIPDAQIRPKPSLEVLYPEIKMMPLRDRLKTVGMDANDLGIALDILMDGRKIGDFKQEGRKKIDLILKATEEEMYIPEQLYNSLIAIRGEKALPVYSLSELVRTTGITQIRHLERMRAITLQVTPPGNIPLQQAMEIINDVIVQPMKRQGMLKGMDVTMTGAADKLTATRKALQWNFILAVIITYLLMCALFENFIYPFVIIFTVPLAAGGGFIGLKLVNLCIASQPFDILTMLGFVILIGVAVNNAILIVHQALNNIRYHGMEYRRAVIESTRTRLRPIYMSAATSVFGMLPLVIAPGPGSELYRGLGSVVLGGLAFSTIFTVFLIPAILIFFISAEKSVNISKDAT